MTFRVRVSKRVSEHVRVAQITSAVYGMSRITAVLLSSPEVRSGEVRSVPREREYEG